VFNILVLQVPCRWQVDKSVSWVLEWKRCVWNTSVCLHEDLPLYWFPSTLYWVWCANVSWAVSSKYITYVVTYALNSCDICSFYSWGTCFETWSKYLLLWLRISLLLHKPLRQNQEQDLHMGHFHFHLYSCQIAYLFFIIHILQLLHLISWQCDISAYQYTVNTGLKSSCSPILSGFKFTVPTQ
jgi:hypothetical protein